MHNFPAERDFTVRMGYFGTLAKRGEVIGTTNSGEGGDLEETYEIPASLKGCSSDCHPHGCHHIPVCL